MHEHHVTGAAPTVTALVIGAGLIGLLAVYLAGVAGARRRGRHWPVWRTACLVAGVVLAVVAVGPIGVAGHHDFVAHMWGHLLLGMLAPLLLVVSAPVTVLLRGLPVGTARRLSRLLSTAYVRAVTHPVVAAALNIGGLWLLYTTPVHTWMHTSTLGHVVIHLHVLLAGWVFTAAILQTDPTPHPYGHGHRAAVLVGFLGLHAILAKHIYAVPPLGVPAAEARAGAQLMYYGGDYIDLVLITLFCLDWYRRTAPRQLHPARAVASGA